MKQPVANVDARGLALLVVFDPEGTATRVFHRKLGDRLLSFSRDDAGQLVDDQTGSTWNRSGEAVAGPLKGKTMQQQVSIPSFKRSWLTFHAESRLIDLTASREDKK